MAALAHASADSTGDGMSNILYLTCRLHPTQAESFVISSRSVGAPYRVNPRHSAVHFQESLAKWLEKHGSCGDEGFDHFTVSYAVPKNSDAPPKPNLIEDMRTAYHSGKLS